MAKPIQPDIPEGSQRYFTNCRGVNLTIPLPSVWESVGYVPKVRNDTGSIGELLTLSYDASSAFKGTNKTAQWYYYNSKDAENALSILRGSGINAVRIFLDYYLYEYLGDEFLNRLKNFLSLCDKYKIRCQFVLWEQFDIIGSQEVTSTEPKTRSTAGTLEHILYNMCGPKLIPQTYSNWANCPAFFETSSAVQAQDFYDNKAVRYVDAIVSSCSSYQSMWSMDVQNESERDHLRLITSSTSNYIRANYPFIKTTFGHGGGFDPGLNYLYRDTGGAQGSISDLYTYSGTVDFASLHTYGNNGYWVKRYYRESVSGANDTELPSMYNEAANYGSVSLPRDMIQYIHRDKDFGGLIYQGFSERNGTSNPFNYVQGIFFPDGTCRRKEDIQAYQSLAKDQWDFGRRQLSKIVEKVASVDGGYDGGFGPGSISGVIPSFDQVKVLPEHAVYKESYSGISAADWLILITAFYGGLGNTYWGLVNPSYDSLSAYGYVDLQGSPYSNVGNGKTDKWRQPKYNLFGTSGYNASDIYNAFFTLSSLPSLASYGTDSSSLDARNEKVQFMSNVIYLLTSRMLAASGQWSIPDILRESLYGTAYDDFSGIHEVVSLEDRLAFSAAYVSGYIPGPYSGLSVPGGASSTMPAINGWNIKGMASEDASAFTCHSTSACFYAGDGSYVENPTMDDIDWTRYDEYFSNLIDRVRTCVVKIQRYGEVVDEDFRLDR